MKGSIPAPHPESSHGALLAALADRPAGHCWHMRKMEALPPYTGDGKGLSTLTERCCWCGVLRSSVRKAVEDPDHGPHVKNVVLAQVVESTPVEAECGGRR